MKKGNLILYEKETDYAVRFMEYMNGIGDFPLEVQVFTNLDAIKEYFEKHEADIFLVSTGILLEQIDVESTKHVVYLTEDAEEEDLDKFIIYKLQSMETIQNQLFQIWETYEKKEKKQSKKRTDLEIIGVTSPFGGSGKTLFSLAYGQAAAKNKKSLYIGMEPIKSFDRKEKGGGSFSELLYYVKQRNEELESVISKLVCKVGEIDCISSVDFYEDLCDMERKEVDFLFEYLYKQLEYDFVIFDMGLWNEITMYLLQKVDRIYMLEAFNFSVFPKEIFLWNHSLIEKTTAQLEDKLCWIKMPFDQNIGKGDFKIEKMLKTKMGQWVWNIRENELINGKKN